MELEHLETIGCPCAAGWHVATRLWDVQDGDVVHAPTHGVLVMRIDRMPRSALEVRGGLVRFSWSAHGAVGVSVMTPYSLVGVVRPAPRALVDVPRDPIPTTSWAVHLTQNSANRDER